MMPSPPNSILLILCPVYGNNDVFLFSSQVQSMTSITVAVIPQMTHMVQKDNQKHTNDMIRLSFLILFQTWLLNREILFFFSNPNHNFNSRKKNKCLVRIGHWDIPCLLKGNFFLVGWRGVVEVVGGTKGVNHLNHIKLKTMGRECLKKEQVFSRLWSTEHSNIQIYQLGFIIALRGTWD